MWTQAVAGVLLAANVVVPASSAAAAGTTTVTVNSGAATTPLQNPAWNQNQTGPVLTPGQAADVQVFQPRITRVWASPKAYVSNSGTYQFDKVDPVIASAAGYSQRLMINMLPCKDADLDAVTTCQTYLKDGLRHFKQQFPGLEYVEIFNEPDKWWPVPEGTDPAMTPQQYYPWYAFGYRMVDELNAELQPAIPLKVGGPVGATFNYKGYLKTFFDLYKGDTDPAKRLDFVSWHEYGVPNSPASAGTEKSNLRDLLSEAGLSPAIPGYVTESGIYPGDVNDGPVLADDQLTQAAGMASLDTYYALSKIDGVFQWTFQQDNQRKSMFVNGTGNVLPYYNVVRMESMLKSGMLPATTISPAPPAGGLGVSALPTRDQSGEAVLLTNYQGLTGTAARTVTLDPGTPPWPGRKIRVERYLVNKTTSNYNYRPEQQALQKVEDFTLAAGASAKRTITLQPDAISLFVYTPQP